MSLQIKLFTLKIKAMNTKKLSQIVTIFIFSLLIGTKINAQSQSLKAQIKFTKFSVTTDKKKIAIDWSTDNTVSTNYFEIQKSLDGVNFKTIALVLGPDPKQLSCDCYGCFDKYISKNAAHSYYRLKHVDVNGEEQISETKLLARI